MTVDGSDLLPPFDEYAPALRAAIRCLRERSATLRQQGGPRHQARADELETHGDALIKLARYLGDVTPPQGIQLGDRSPSRR